jgi:hypothetical protein
MKIIIKMIIMKQEKQSKFKNIFLLGVNVKLENQDFS